MVIKNRGFAPSEKLWLSSWVAFLLLIALVGCRSEPSGPTSTTAEPTGQLTGYTGCSSPQLTGPADDCLEYEYFRDGSLHLRHVGAGFNCCPGEISATITISANEVVIAEAESESACRCLCLYTIEYEIKNLQRGRYEIRLLEPYVTDEDDPLVCTIDLTASSSGRCCVERNHYPWD